VISFDELPLSAPIAQAVKGLGYEKPSPIQAQALPLLLGPATDFIGLAATGTGKTAAFSIPMLERMDPKLRATQSLILCPTRELALQVAGQINILGKFLGLRALPIYGGSDYGSQLSGLRAGAPIVVGTPGRLIGHLDRGTLKLDNVSTIILDEADEMISMGFKEELEKILQATNRKTSNIWLFSATMGREVRRVADTYLRKPKQVQVNRDEMLSTTVEQLFYPTRESNKADILCKIIESSDDFYGLVFCQTKALVTDLTTYLNNQGYKADSLHGDKDQRAREKTMQAFRDKKVTILVCTDVASRGLDVKDVTHVINYSIPRELDNYVHRIGRTARSGKSGIAISLVTPSHRPLIRRIEEMTKSKMTEGRIPSRREVGTKKISKVLEQFLAQTAHSRAMELFGEDWKKVISEMPADEIVGRFLVMISPEIFEDRKIVKAVLGPFAGAPEPGKRSTRSDSRPRREHAHKGPRKFEARRGGGGSTGRSGDSAGKSRDRFKNHPHPNPKRRYARQPESKPAH